MYFRAYWFNGSQIEVIKLLLHKVYGTQGSGDRVYSVQNLKRLNCKDHLS